MTVFARSSIRMASGTQDRARRLLALMPHLQPGRIDLGRLASLTGTDTATVAADLATLSLCGADQSDVCALVPVLTDGESAEVWSELPALREPVRLTSAEARALLAALGATGVDADAPLARRLTDMAARTLDAGEIARTVRAAAMPGGVVYAATQLTAAAGGRRVTVIEYTAQDRCEPTARTVQPWSVVYSRGAAYLSAWDEDRGAERTFRLDRISSVTVTGRTFERPATLPASFDAAPDPEALPRARIEFAHDAPDLNGRDWPGATFERPGDGSVHASVPYAGTAWIARKVAAKLGDAVVALPVEVREAVKRLSRQALDDL
jgi:proteasome accessory factor C